MSREDPKPGRWILPLVVAGIIGFTYTFVNALSPATVAVSEETTVAPASTTSEAPATTTSTTLPVDAQAFVDRVDELSDAAGELVSTAQTLNDDWDAREIEFGEIRSGLEQLIVDTDAFVAEVVAVEVPGSAAATWEDVTVAGDAMVVAAEDMLDGLVNSEGSEDRLAALDEYTTAEGDLQSGFDAAVDAATG